MLPTGTVHTFVTPSASTRRWPESPTHRVALVLPFEVWGAAEDYALTVAQALAELNWAVTLVHPEGLPFPGKVLNRELNRLSVPISRLIRPPSLWRLIHRLQPDILHVNHIFLPAMAAGVLTKLPVVVTVHTPALSVRYSRRGRFLLRWSTPRVAAWIVLSPRNARLLRSRVSLGGPERVATIPPGLPNERFDAQLSRDQARGVLRLPTDAFIVGSVGRLSAQKRPDILIRAAAELRRSMANLRVVMFGDGELRQEMESLSEAQAPGTIVFTGHRDDVVTLLPALDVFCLTSDFEGLPFALLEAMATGLPIVATDVQGSGEAIIDNIHGLLTLPGDTVATARAIERLARDKALRARLGSSARDRFHEIFTADRMVDAHIRLYSRLLERQRQE